MSEAFRNLFLPNNQVPPTGQFTRRLDLAAVLDAVAVKGISEFYSGSVAQGMAVAVRTNIFFLPIYQCNYISVHEFCIASMVSCFPSQTLGPCYP